MSKDNLIRQAANEFEFGQVDEGLMTSLMMSGQSDVREAYINARTKQWTASVQSEPSPTKEPVLDDFWTNEFDQAMKALESHLSIVQPSSSGVGLQPRVSTPVLRTGRVPPKDVPTLGLDSVIHFPRQVKPHPVPNPQANDELVKAQGDHPPQILQDPAMLMPGEVRIVPDEGREKESLFKVKPFTVAGKRNPGDTHTPVLRSDFVELPVAVSGKPIGSTGDGHYVTETPFGPPKLTVSKRAKPWRRIALSTVLFVQLLAITGVWSTSSACAAFPRVLSSTQACAHLALLPFSAASVVAQWRAWAEGVFVLANMSPG